MDKDSKTLKRFQLQDEKYKFPYHYIPNISDGGVRRYKIFSFGFEYMCYILHVKEIVESYSPNSILDVGCGDGRFLDLIGNEEYERLVGVDLSHRAIKHAEAMNPEIEFINKDAEELSEKFDIVTAIEVLEHIPDEETDKFFKTLEKRTKRNGKIIISVPTMVKPMIKKHYRHYDLNLFKKELESSGEELEIVNVDYIFRKSFFFKLYNKLTKNKIWFFDPRFLKKWLWKYIWNNLRFADEENGEHMVVVLEKDIN